MRGDFCLIAPDVVLGRDAAIHDFVNLYGWRVGDSAKTASFAGTRKGVHTGRKRKVSSRTFTCEAVTDGDVVFIGRGVNFINDKYPRAATAAAGLLQTEADGAVERTTTVRRGAGSGTGATIR